MRPQLQLELVKGQLRKFTVSITGTTAVHCLPRKARLEQCPEPFRLNPRGSQRPALMEFLSSKADMQRQGMMEGHRDAAEWQ